MYVRYDIRFMAKLAIGLGHILFGEKFDNSGYARELHKALWYKEGDPEPRIVGESNLSQDSEFLKNVCGITHGVTLTILPSSKYVVLNLNLARKMNWVIGIAEIEDVKGCVGEDLLHGLCVLLFKPLGKGFRLSLPELIAHNSNEKLHPKLAEVESHAGKSVGYFENL